MNKVVVLGLDGATFEMLNPMLDTGRLPVLARLLRTGARGILASSLPPYTCPAWPTMFTGRNPGAHGVVFWRLVEPDAVASRTATLVDVACPRLWTLLNQAGVRTGIFNLPVTYPAEPVDGFMVSGYLAPRDAPQAVQPVRLREAFATAFPDYDLNGQVPTEYRDKRSTRPKAMAYLRHGLLHRQAALEWLLKREPVDFLWVVLETIDRIGHEAFGLVTPGSLVYDTEEGREAREMALTVLETMDRVLDRILHWMGPDPTVLVVSDHGFQWFDRTFDLQGWLVANGFMTPDRRLRTRTALLARSLVVQTLGWGAWAWIRSFLERFSGRHGEKKDPCRATWGRDATRIWDWPSSKTWFGPVFEWGVRYNARRCRERGTQEAEERARILHDLRERLSAAADPATGDPVFRLVKPREEAYAGPYVCRAADLILVPKPHVSCVNSPGVGASEATGWLLPVSEDAVRGGNHYGDGVFAATGGPFRRGEVTGIGILDIMPTVLHLFGLRVPADLEGRIVEETFDPSFRAAHPVQRSAGAFKPGETASPGIACTADEGQRMDRRPEEQGSL